MKFDHLVFLIGESERKCYAFNSKGNVISEIQEIQREDLGNVKAKNTYLIGQFPNFFFETYHLSLPVFNPEIIKIRLNERVSNVGYITEPVEIYWKLLQRDGDLYKISYLSVPKSALLKRKAEVTSPFDTNLQVYTHEVIALIGSLSAEEIEPGILLFRRQGTIFFIILSDKGNLVAVEELMVNEMLGVNPQEVISRIEFLRNLFSREHGLQLDRIYLFQSGFKEEISPFLEGIYEIEEVRFRWKVDEEHREKVWVAGVLSVPDDYNFLPKEERETRKVFSYLKVACLMIFAVTLFQGIGVTLLSWKNKKLAEEIKHLDNRERAIIEEVSSQFQNITPERLSYLKNRLEEIEKIQRFPKVDTLLVKTSQIGIPIKITGLSWNALSGSNYTNPVIHIKGIVPSTRDNFAKYSMIIENHFNENLKIQSKSIQFDATKEVISFDIKGELVQAKR